MAEVATEGVCSDIFRLIMSEETAAAISGHAPAPFLSAA